MIVTVRADRMIEFFASLPSPNLTINVIEGRTLQVRGRTGEPARLLDMISRHEPIRRFGGCAKLVRGEK